MNDDQPATNLNVHDHLKHLTVGQIKSKLNESSFPCAVMMQHISGDFNMGCIIRAANNFNVKKTFYYGHKQWDRRAAIGTYHYKDLEFIKSINDLLKLKEEYIFVGIENNLPNSVSIKNFEYPKNSLFFFGEEKMGLTDEIISVMDYIVEIPSLGSVRSLNVSACAAIVMYDYVSKYINFEKENY